MDIAGKEKPRQTRAGRNRLDRRAAFAIGGRSSYRWDMSDVTIKHNLGRDGAKERLAEGLAIMRKSFGQYVSKTEETWPGPYDATLTFSFLGAKASGHATVTDSTVEVSLGQLPLVLKSFRGYVLAYIEKHGPTFFAKDSASQ